MTTQTSALEGPPPRQVLTVEQVRQELGVSHATIYRLLATGDLASFKVGRCRRVAAVDLQDFIERQRVRAASDGWA